MCHCRYALLSLRHGNTKNQAEIITAIRASPALAKDIRRLDAASELLRFEDGTPVKARSIASLSYAAPLTPPPPPTSEVSPLTTPTRTHTHANPHSPTFKGPVPPTFWA